MVRDVLVVILDAPPLLRRALVTCCLARRVGIRFAPGKMTQEARRSVTSTRDTRPGAQILEGLSQRLQSTALSRTPGGVPSANG